MNLRKLFRLKAPCVNCPFLKAGGIELNPGRLEGIKSHLLRDDFSSFYCHKTTHHTGEEEGEDGGVYTPSGKEAHCAGAVAFLLSRGRHNIAMRLAFIEGHIAPADFAPAINMIATES
ncbi:hypothetical protein [Pantoea sp. GD03673]|uniref:hypothetical protein n=1 Tax=Pantoea sp. GD03673 TaxID=2975364 RepID=UPI002448F7F7|nr:hypothetical protein [Pantoea sp. GD03673]MDH2069477.1 hypothetical protein [Pantoea sp. GD03673]